ncbi:MAG: stage II sporulation protein P, partial [Caldanaerobacter sp.]
MKKTRNKLITYLIFALIVISIPIEGFGNSGYYTVYDIKTEKVLFRTAMEVHEKDMYLSGDNKLYEVVKVDKSERIAYAKYIRTEKLPEVKEEISAAMALVQETGEKRIAIYSTHSDES